MEAGKVTTVSVMSFQKHDGQGTKKSVF